MLLDILLPTRGLQTQARDKLLGIRQAAAVVVSGVLDEEVVLEQLIGSSRRHEALVGFRIYLNIASLLSSDGLEIGQNLGWGIVVIRGKDLSTDQLSRLFDGSENKLAFKI